MNRLGFGLDAGDHGKEAVERGFHAIMDLAILGQELQAKVTASKQPNVGRPLDRPNDL